MWAVGADSISARYIRAFAGASGTPPPTRSHMVAVGANSVRPGGLAAAQDCPGGFYIRPLYTRFCRGVGAWRRTTSAAIQQSWPARAVQCPTGALIAARPRNAAPYKRPHGGCRGEHCSPAKISRCRKSPGRIWNPPLRTTKKPQQRIETANHLIVECWPRAGASPSALGFLRARLRSVRAKREPKRP